MPSSFANVILPLPLPKLYTYYIPEGVEKQVTAGKRVIVQFGKKKMYAALVATVHNERPDLYEAKAILEVIDEEPIVNGLQLEFWKWISAYYLCPIGDVLKAALPSGFRLESESKVILNADFEGIESFSLQEELLHKLLEKEKMLTINEISSVLLHEKTLRIIKTMAEKGAVHIIERVSERYRPKSEQFILPAPHLQDENELKMIFDQLSKAPKQLDVLMSFIQLSGLFGDKEPRAVPKTDLLKASGATSSQITDLVKKNILCVSKKGISRLSSNRSSTSQIKELNPAQKIALGEIQSGFETKGTVLLHGITSSGKTEIYIHLIQEFLEKGKQVLYLLPEIALTSQIINRLRSVFGDVAGVYHSKFSDHERVEVWNALLNKIDGPQYQVILGVRSSIFLPFDRLGLIIIDEEHENSYKQYDPSPRYNARDAAMVLAGLHGAKILMGTATPSIESYYNASTGKYALVELATRYLDISLPEICVVDTKRSYKRKEMQSLFSKELIQMIGEALIENEQVILFQNRRGFSPYLECKLCNWIPRCEHCDVNLTYHRNESKLICHHCGFRSGDTYQCKACGSNMMETKGYGTERIEDDISIYFPGTKTARLDLDTTRSKQSYEKIIGDFEKKIVNILVGTQMISKGLDFDNVRVVGIINADNMLNFPDFRAHERSYQLMAQVSGRAGRKNKQGKVIIQTSTPLHKIIQNVINNDYVGMYNGQLEDRRKFGYPPFYRLIEITFKHKNRSELNKATAIIGNDLRKIFGGRVLGPEFPLIERIQDKYLKKIIVKIEKGKSLGKAKALLLKELQAERSGKEFKSLLSIIDVDPQ